MITCKRQMQTWACRCTHILHQPSASAQTAAQCGQEGCHGNKEAKLRNADELSWTELISYRHNTELRLFQTLQGLSRLKDFLFCYQNVCWVLCLDNSVCVQLLEAPLYQTHQSLLLYQNSCRPSHSLCHHLNRRHSGLPLHLSRCRSHSQHPTDTHHKHTNRKNGNRETLQSHIRFSIIMQLHLISCSTPPP